MIKVKSSMKVMQLKFYISLPYIGTDETLARLVTREICDVSFSAFFEVKSLATFFDEVGASVSQSENSYTGNTTKITIMMFAVIHHTQAMEITIFRIHAHFVLTILNV